MGVFLFDFCGIFEECKPATEGDLPVIGLVPLYYSVIRVGFGSVYVCIYAY